MPVSTIATAAVAAETVYPIMVNGYMCYSAAEAAAVRRGQSPDSVHPGATAAQQDGVQQAWAQTQIEAQAQLLALAQSQARLDRFAQLSEDQQRQFGQDSRRGQLVDLYA